jgi:hypothetical protein
MRMNDDSALADIVKYLYKTPYGHEDLKVLKQLRGLLARQHHAGELLSWHLQFRMWLLEGTNNDNIQHDSCTILPLILSKLQESLLHDSSSLLWDETQHGDNGTTSWKQDAMLQEWSVARWFVVQDVRDKNLDRQQQLDVDCIIAGIDKLIEHESQENDDETNNPARVLLEYCQRHQQQEETKSPINSWLACHFLVEHQDDDHGVMLNVERLLQAVEQGPQSHVRKALESIPSHDFIWTSVCRYCSRSNNNYRKGRALLASMLVHLSDSRIDALASVPTLKDIVTGLVRDYLLKDDNDKTPNVHQLALDLWDYHLQRGDCLDVFREFASWLPIEPLATRYRALWTMQKHSNKDSRRILLRATDVMCVLIANDDIQEWQESVWNDEMIQMVLLPLVHQVDMNLSSSSDATESSSTFGAVMDRILRQPCGVNVLLVCPRLAWIVRIFGSVVPGNDVMNDTCLNAMLKLKPEESSSLMSMYIESILDVSTLSHSSEAAVNTWIQHVVQTLGLFQRNDRAATEWFRCLRNRQDTHAVTTTLHQHVCRFLCRPEVKTSIPLSTLLADSRDVRILSWTPPECLFANTSDLVTSLKEMLSTFGDLNEHLVAITVGLALVLPTFASSTFACRDVLYQKLAKLVANDDNHQFVQSIEREIASHPACLKWWSELHADLVRNEVPLFKVKEQPSGFDIHLLDEFLMTRCRKRPREERVVEDADDDVDPPQDNHDIGQPEKLKARSRESASTIIQNLYGVTEQTKEQPTETATLQATPVAAPENEFSSVGEHNADSLSGNDSDSYEDQDDEEILLL